MTSTPNSTRPRTKGSRSLLSETETSARLTFTLSSSLAARSHSAGPSSLAHRPRRSSLPAPPAFPEAAA